MGGRQALVLRQRGASRCIIGRLSFCRRFNHHGAESAAHGASAEGGWARLSVSVL